PRLPKRSGPRSRAAQSSSRGRGYYNCHLQIVSASACGGADDTCVLPDRAITAVCPSPFTAAISRRANFSNEIRNALKRNPRHQAGVFACQPVALGTRMATAVVAHIRSGVWIVAPETLHAVFDPSAAARVWFSVVTGIRIIRTAVVGSTTIVATVVIRCSKRPADERARGKSAGDTPTPSRTPPTPTAAAPTNPSRIL